jgi:hypothetical protein
MQVQEVIDKLTADMGPAPRGAVSRRLTVSLVVGGLAAFLLLLVCFGMRDDMSSAMFTSAFWMKWAFVLAGGIPAFVLARRLARPDGKVGGLWLMLLAPLVILASFAAVRMFGVPAEIRAALWLGHSASACPWIIGGLSIPVFAATLVAFRRSAPTRLSLAGFTAGLLSGTVAAFLYALCCNETEPAFVVTWYTLGMLLPALAGAVLGPKVLRW